MHLRLQKGYRAFLHETVDLELRKFQKIPNERPKNPT